MDRPVKSHQAPGQHFLIDHECIHRLLSYLPSEAQQIWEFGAGSGNITQALLKQHKSVRAFELDPHYLHILREKFIGHSQNFQIVAGDMRHTWKAEKVPDAIVGNLPFSVATRLLEEIALQCSSPPPMVFIVQKEVAQKLRSAEGRKSQTFLSALLQSLFYLHLQEEIPPHCFSPRPKVTSMIVQLVARNPLPSLCWRQLFLDLCKPMFRHRRKTLQNVLKIVAFPRGLERERVIRALHTLSVSLMQRAEQLPVQLWGQLTEILSNQGPSRPF